jgi:hypothetical protein
VHSGASRVRNINALFFILRWTRCQFHKKHARARYAKLVFLHSVRFGGHVACSSAPVVQIVNALFFILGWAQCRSRKRRARTCYAELVFLYAV